MNRQVFSEAMHMLAQRELKPTVCLAYERRALYGTDISDLRVPLDTEATTRREGLLLESGVYGKNLLPEGQWLMEIKAACGRSMAKADMDEKAFIGELRCRNGNLSIALVLEAGNEEF